MSRSGNYRAVLGTSWRRWRGRWCVLSPSWIFGASCESAGGCDEGGREEAGVGSGWKRDERGESTGKQMPLFILPTTFLDPRHTLLSSAT